ncbi:MAG: hypothetical protein KBD12_00460 [Candidatus Pacebacteria bacterium]|nr:hypothetical protein [Candidatus Paceibacterota bacterium]
MEENQSFLQKNKKEVIIISIVVIFLIVVGILFFLNNKKQTTNTPGKIVAKGEGTSLYSRGNNSDNSDDENQNQTNDNYDGNYYSEGLINVWDRPVAGYGFYYKNNNPVLIFVDSDTGFLYQKNLNEPTSTPIQITNSSFPNIRKAYFLDIYGEKKVILQYSANNTIKSLIASIPDYFSLPNELKNIKTLDNNITNISISLDSTKALYIVTKNKTTGNKKDLFSDWYLIDGTSNTKIYSSEISTWKSQITDSGKIYVYNNDTSLEKSPLYKFNTDTESLKQIYYGHIGSSYLVNNSSIMTSILTNNGLRLYKNENFGGNYFEDSSLSELNFNSLSNKCFLSNVIFCGAPKEIKNYDIRLPDAWYQGLTSWQDDIFIVNKDYPKGQLFFDLNIDGGVDNKFDIKDLKVNKNEDHLLFINKNDGSLWSINIGNILESGD